MLMSLRVDGLQKVTLDSVAGLALDVFERQVEAFVRARTWREWQFLSLQRPGRSLNSLYEADFPDFTSTDLWADLQAATPDDARQHRSLSALLASAELEGRTREFASRVTRVQASHTIDFEGTDMPWRDAPARWSLLPEVPRRHALEESWRSAVRSEVNPTLERWQEELRRQLGPLGATDWLTFWSDLRGVDLAEVAKLANGVLQATGDVYGHGLSIYLNQLELPIDDAWTSDVDWAFRAPRFDAIFPERPRMPLLIRVFRDLGVELTEQTSVRLEYGPQPGLHVIPLDVPNEVHVLLRLGGGWQDYARSLLGLGMTQHLVHTDPSLGSWERWLGDETPTLGYGLLMEGLLRDKAWLLARLEYGASEDFRAIGHLAWLYRVRGAAARALYEQRLGQAEPGGALAADFEEALSSATRVRHFPEQYLGLMDGAPWSTLSATTQLRAEVFAAQLRAFLQREFDEEWWRSERAARFIKDELWRPGRRHTAEELLGFMGFEGFDASVLSAEFEEVLRPL
jgi:hypothetical protein